MSTNNRNSQTGAVSATEGLTRRLSGYAHIGEGGTLLPIVKSMVLGKLSSTVHLHNLPADYLTLALLIQKKVLPQGLFFIMVDSIAKMIKNMDSFSYILLVTTKILL